MPTKKSTFASGAHRSEVIKARFDLIPPQALRRLALRYGLGAVAYGEHNWQKGLPFSDTLNHIQEHLERVKDRVNACIADARGDEQAIHSVLAHEFTNSDDDLAGAAWGCFALMTLIDEGKLLPDESWKVKK